MSVVLRAKTIGKWLRIGCVTVYKHHGVVACHKLHIAADMIKDKIMPHKNIGIASKPFNVPS